ncbi:MAG: hypothetical protein ACYC5Q_15890 [Thermoleophilia bacterium]
MIVATTFWGSIIAAVAAAAAAAVRTSPALFVTAAILGAPPALYLSASPRFQTVGFLVSVLPLIAAVFVTRLRWLAVALVAPLFFTAAWLLYAVLRHYTGIG